MQSVFICKSSTEHIGSNVWSPLFFQSHFEDNPRDLQVLRHDQVLQPKRVQSHLKHVPTYLGRCVGVGVWVSGEGGGGRGSNVCWGGGLMCAGDVCWGGG